MIKNFLIIALRQLLKNKTYSIINIGGLGIGLACCVVIGLYIHDELSYDRFHPNQNVYRVTEMQEQAGDLYPVAVTPGLLARELKNDFAAIEQTCRIGTVWRSPVFQSEDRSIEPGALLVVDNSLFTMFHFPLLYGDPATALSGPNDVVLTKNTAVSLFGAEWGSKNVLGKEIKFNNDRVLTIAGIAENPPENSHIQFNALLSITYDEAKSDNFAWNSNNYHTYISLAPGTDLGAFKAAIFHYLNKFDKERKITLDLQHLPDIHLHSDFAFQTDWSKHGSFLYIKVFLAVGSIVLLIAIFNFINLCTARAIVSIVNLLSVDFVKLVLISIVIATPIAWWTMNEWLKAFAYRISMGSGTFLSAAILVLIIALITVSFQSFRAAMSDPVKTLRSE